jgi:hypothetical protein
MFMYLCYLDDSGSDKENNIAVVGAVLIPEVAFSRIEKLAGTLVELIIPKEQIDEFEEFHAADLYFGNELFKGMADDDRFRAIKSLLSIQVPFIYSAVDKKALSRTAFGNANPIDLAFRMCTLGIEQWLSKNARKDESCNLLIMDETRDERLKRDLRISFRALRGQARPPHWLEKGRLSHLHDDMYFGDSRDSIGIQMADVRAYFLLRCLNKKSDPEDFFRLYEKQAICSKVEPEWFQLKEVLVEHEPLQEEIQMGGEADPDPDEVMREREEERQERLREEREQDHRQMVEEYQDEEKG